MVWFTIFAVLAIGIAFWLRQKRRAAQKTATKSQKNPFASNEFVAGKHCCAAAAPYSGRRFLIVESPRLPLENCSDPDFCSCRFRSVDDRRSSDDRRSVVGALSTEMPIGDERSNRRAGRDRRKEDISFDYKR